MYKYVLIQPFVDNEITLNLKIDFSHTFDVQQCN